MNKKILTIIICTILIVILLLPSLFIKNEKYTVTFEFNNGKENFVVEVTEGDKVKEIDKPTKEDYIFVYWKLDGKKYNFDTPIDKNIVLEALWIEDHDNSNEQENEISTTRPVEETSTTRPVEETLTEENKETPTTRPVEETSTTRPVEESSIKENVQQNTQIESTVTKVKKYTVIFNSNGGSNIESQSVNEKEKIKEPKNPVKKGYTFLGWYINNEKYNFETEVNNNITLVAKWEQLNK